MFWIVDMWNIYFDTISSICLFTFFYNQVIVYLWNKQQDVKMGRLPETSRVPQKSCGKPI